MFSKERPYRFHLELTDKCNAGCPMCSRTDPANFCKANDKVQKLDLTLADFERHFTPEFCARTEHIELGGGLGDPLAARDCLEICDHLTRYGVNLVVSTNGGLRNTQWWEKLGHILQRTDSVVQLHVDGLKDTNPLYRVNTDFDKIMANAQAYLATGAPAEWYYILFRHNEHQVEEARDLSRRMGFRNFVLIDTIRFGKRDSFPYRLPNGEWHALEPATLTSADFEKKFQQEASSSKSQGASLPSPLDPIAAKAAAGVNGIRCKSQIHNRPYINCEGFVSPCCWMATSPEEVFVYEQAGLDMANYNIRNRLLSDILHDEPFASLYERDWETGNNPICNRKCRDMVRNTRAAV